MNTKTHRFENPFRVMQELLRGRSLTRSLFNLTIEHYEMQGEVLDLGSKNGASSYLSHIKRSDNCNITFTDLMPGPGVTPVDVEKPFPFPDASFDTVLSFHLIEHVYNFWKMPKEIHRVLKPGGCLIVAVPFIHEYHGDPGDYWRMSDVAVCRLFESAGLSVKSVELVGEGIVTFALTKVFGLLLPRIFKPYGMVAGYIIATGLDRLVNFVRGSTNNRCVAERFALDVVCHFEKNPLAFNAYENG